jgi:hypothetical protein
MAEMIYAPDDISQAKTATVFMAGSIDMGKAVDWQQQMFKKTKDLNITYLNPRRPDWDSSWKQEIENEEFSKQVNWELDSLDVCDTIVLYFSKESQAPISLLELGLNAGSGKVLVCCPKGYWKKGNVDIVCKRNDIPVFESMDEIVGVLKLTYA